MNNHLTEEWSRLHRRGESIIEVDEPDDQKHEAMLDHARALLSIANRLVGIACPACNGVGKRLQPWGMTAAFRDGICPDCGGSGEDV